MAVELRLKIATAPRRTWTRWKTEEVTWRELVGRLRELKRTSETRAEYERMTHDQRSQAKDVGGFVGGALNSGRRTANSVTERWLITLDADRGDGSEWDNYTCLYDYAACMYATHSHTPEAPRVRFVLPMSRAVDPEEYVAIARMAATWFGIDAMDPTTYQPERLMYWPSLPKDVPNLFDEVIGEPVDPDEVLGMYGPGGAWRDISLWPMGKDEVEIVRKHGEKQGDPTQKPDPIGKFCRFVDIHDAIERYLSDKYIPSDGLTDDVGGPARYTYALGQGSNGAVVYDHGMFLYSNHMSDPAGGKLCNAFDLVRLHLFGAQDAGKDGEKDVTKLPSYKAMCEWLSDNEDFQRWQVMEQNAEIEERFGDLLAANNDVVSVDETTGEVVEVEADPDWELAIVKNRRTQEPLPLIDNALVYLHHDPYLRGKIAYNEWTDRVVLMGPVPWHMHLLAGEKWGHIPWTDEDTSGLRWYLEKFRQFDSFPRVDEAFNLIKSETKFHPIRDYLNGLEWDGFERLDTMIIRYLGAEDTKYVRTLTRKWMVGAVKRVMEPGCKFDTVLLFQGPQGIGKSMFGQVLSKGWFSDSVPTLGVDKRAYEALRGKWIIEIAEMASAKKADQESQKTFLTATRDSYRPPYARQIRDFPRQCVFYATTNENEPLHDFSGARRFWPIVCKGVDHGYPIGFDMPNEVDQLWAEAVARYRAGETAYVRDAMLEAELKEQQEMMSVEDPDFELVREYLDRLWPEDWAERTLEFRQAVAQGETDSYLLEGVELNTKRDVVCITQIKEELYGIPRNQQHKNDKLSRMLPGILGRMPGWKKEAARQYTPIYGQQRVYVRS